MAHSDPINPTQLAVLKWVADGCPDGVMPDGGTHKTSAKALQWRRLLEVSTKGGAWSARLTAAGHHYLAHGSYPDGHWTTRKRGAALSSRPQLKSPARPRTAVSPRPPRAKVTDKKLRPVDQLIADVVAAGGRLEVVRKDDKGPRYEALVKSAIRFNKVPAGKILAVERGARWGEATIVLTDPPEWMTVALEPLPVPERVSKFHPALAQGRARATGKRNSPLRQRGHRILHAIAVASSARGFEVAAAVSRDRYGNRTQQRPPHDLDITVSGHTFTVSVTEPTKRVEHQPTPAELRQAEKYSWTTYPKYDYVPAGLLKVEVGGGAAVRQGAWTDRDGSLTDVAQILQEIELRTAEAEVRRLERERQEREKRQRWEQAMDVARQRYAEYHRASVLSAQMDRWRRTQDLDQYLAAMRARAQTLPAEEHHDAHQWIAWVQQHRDAIDPLTKALAMPPIPDPKPEDLKPHLGGWSPYGPESTFGWRS